jgi:AraC-like DNA-binding protein
MSAHALSSLLPAEPVAERQPLELASSPEAYAAAPVGKYFAGPCFLTWTYSPSLTGTILWGEPAPRDCELLCRAWRHVEVLEAGYDAVIDMSRIARIDAGGFGVVWQFLTDLGDRYYKRLGKQAIVRGTSLSEPVVEGFFGVIGGHPAVKTFADPNAAWGWIGRDEALPARQEAAILTEEALATPVLLRELRRLLGGHLEEGIPLGDCAKHLHTSERTLQRHLHEHGTSFRKEVDGVRFFVARQQLLDTDQKLEVIAHAVGMSSVSQLSLLFRRTIGVTPGEFRRKSRM